MLHPTAGWTATPKSSGSIVARALVISADTADLLRLMSCTDETVRLAVRGVPAVAVTLTRVTE